MAKHSRPSAPDAMRARRRLRVARAASSALIVLGLGMLLYVNVLDWQASATARAQVSELADEAEGVSSADAARLMEWARAYNAALHAGAGAVRDGAAHAYEEQLAVGEDGAMASLQIDKIALSLPIFHGTGDEALMNGVGHLEGTALPVGGEGGRCVLLAHSGMRNARMFDELYKLVPGDVFTIRVLDETLAYEVSEVEVVEPDEVEGRIGTVRGEDLVTLVTCTPYGVNSQRLLVHARRTPLESAPERAEELQMGAYVNDRSMPLVAAAALLGGGAVAGLFGKRRSGRARVAWGARSSAGKLQQPRQPRLPWHRDVQIPRGAPASPDAFEAAYGMQGALGVRMASGLREANGRREVPPAQASRCKREAPRGKGENAERDARRRVPAPGAQAAPWPQAPWPGVPWPHVARRTQAAPKAPAPCAAPGAYRACGPREAYRAHVPQLRGGAVWGLRKYQARNDSHTKERR